MRKALAIALLSLLALGVTGVAVAKLRAVGVATATATFDAAKERVNVRTCTGNGDEYVIAGGHHATERLGVQALAAHLAERFGLAWHYVEIDNPI